MANQINKIIAKQESAWSNAGIEVQELVREICDVSPSLHHDPEGGIRSRYFYWRNKLRGVRFIDTNPNNHRNSRRLSYWFPDL